MWGQPAPGCPKRSEDSLREPSCPSWFPLLKLFRRRVPHFSRALCARKPALSLSKGGGFRLENQRANCRRISFPSPKNFRYFTNFPFSSRSVTTSRHPHKRLRGFNDSRGSKETKGPS